MDSTINTIEQAMVARLQAKLQGVVVESYAGQLDDQLATWVRQLPAVWVTFERLPEQRRVSRRKIKATARFQVMVAQRALSGEPAARQGAHGFKGVYDLLDADVKQVLMDSTLGLAIEPLAPAGTQMVAQGYFANEAVAVMSCAWVTAFIESVPDLPEEEPAELHTVGLGYPIKPGDDVADAADVVTLNPATP